MPFAVKPFVSGRNLATIAAASNVQAAKRKKKTFPERYVPEFRRTGHNAGAGNKEKELSSKPVNEEKQAHKGAYRLSNGKEAGEQEKKVHGRKADRSKDRGGVEVYPVDSRGVGAHH
ncbi:hypothetical protein V493_04904 [Pseudogymnoascus sp. VKM F-4281 (FW-2241)]|nr:hypothetical protein V493_04904 [Pseudogymnoascus sp. VKM F-4281 (FW-2241)]